MYFFLRENEAFRRLLAGLPGFQKRYVVMLKTGVYEESVMRHYFNYALVFG
ncbi:MAG: hypothetical protein J7L11_00635 [Thermoprotei archaeon]|nr:hypothetical protein [Thermoprotei archaeon]